MAQITPTVRVPTRTGAEMTYDQVPANTDNLAVTPGHKVHVRNASAGPVTVSYVPDTVSGLTVTAPAGMVIAAGANRIIPAPQMAVYVHDDDEKVRINFSTTAPTITYAVFE